MPAPPGDNRELLAVIAFMRAAAGLGGPDFFTFCENWFSGERLDARLAAPHLVDFAAKMGDLFDDQGGFSCATPSSVWELPGQCRGSALRR